MAAPYGSSCKNADDAATIAALGDEGAIGGLIGAKGLGFKSILEFSDSPEIYSGEFRFRFSREDTRKAMVRGKVKITSARPYLFASLIHVSPTRNAPHS